MKRGIMTDCFDSLEYLWRDWEFEKQLLELEQEREEREGLENIFVPNPSLVH
jgi:hypothetical protein